MKEEKIKGFPRLEDMCEGCEYEKELSLEKCIARLENGDIKVCGAIGQWLARGKKSECYPN